METHKGEEYLMAESVPTARHSVSNYKTDQIVN